jgi:exodeoxyribonuclease VII large subunit
MIDKNLVFSPTDFLAIANQVLETSFGSHVLIEGELANFRVSRNKWIYFDVKDDFSKVSCFGSIYILPGPLQDGMLVKIIGQPRIHPQFGFSLTAHSITPSGEGSIKKAYDLLKANLQKEGLFDEERKRPLPAIPQKVALITSTESAAYSDFIKIITARWPYLNLEVHNVQVQGEPAVNQIANAIKAANSQADLAEVLVLTRGGGSAEDLSVFNDEHVVRAVAGSRIPTLVAIGHERDLSLSEMASDRQASTPSNAAELLVPDRLSELKLLNGHKRHLGQSLQDAVRLALSTLTEQNKKLADTIKTTLNNHLLEIHATQNILEAYNPQKVLSRGYSITRLGNKIVRRASSVSINDSVTIELIDGKLESLVTAIKCKE